MKTMLNMRTICTETDLPDIVRLMKPFETTTVEEMRTWIQDATPGRIANHLVAVDEKGGITGYAYCVHTVSIPAHHFFVACVVVPALRCQGIGSGLWGTLLRFLKEQGATRLASEVSDQDPASLAFAERHGFTIERRLFHSTLDLTTFDETPFLPGIAELEREGIRFCSLADFPDNAETQRKFYELNLATVKDIPGEDWNFDGYPQFFERNIVGGAWFRRENQILAVDGDRFAGMALLSFHPETQSVYNATTGVIRTYRGRKIGLALKVLAACYARQHGARLVSTDNDSSNAPILAINKRMGYQPEPGKYVLVRWIQD